MQGNGIYRRKERFQTVPYIIENGNPNNQGDNGESMRERKLNRLSGYDYSTPGYYFVTICIKYNECLFGDIVNGKMELNEMGKLQKNVGLIYQIIIPISNWMNL